MGLTVLSVAYPFAPVTMDAVGGAEQVLAQLDASLVRAGQRSVVVASEGSQVAGSLITTRLPQGEISDAVRAEVHAEHRRNLERTIERWQPDLVHMHGIDFHQYLPPPGPPVLVTLHLPLAWYPAEALKPRRPGTFLHCVSRSQQATRPPGVNLLDPIENGVPVPAQLPPAGPRDYALSLGRICPEKGYHLALEATRAAGVPYLLAGAVYPYEAHERYYRDEIAPRLDEHRRFLGPVGGQRKLDLLTGALCLLVPSLAPETSSLVAMEALACGTPVVAFAAGALPEIVEHERTGFIVRDATEMAEAIPRCRELDREYCRQVARQRFSLASMTGRYLDLYVRLARRGGVANVA